MHRATTPYRGERYLDADEVRASCEALAAAHPEWVALTVIGESRSGRPIHLVTLGDRNGNPDDAPALWLDGGTHAVEWSSTMSVLAALWRWAETLASGDEALSEAFSRHTVYAVPCVSPDGLQETMHGAPSFRSTTRPPRAGTTRTGFEASDVDGDGQIVWMRWAHPAGSWVADGPLGMRPRTIDDDPSTAFFLSDEGAFLDWDGHRWIAAPLKHGLDLNRNFPVDWAPFSMFGMDSGDYPGSEPESRALLEAVVARPGIAAALTCHTYTGVLLTPPASAETPLPASDVARLQRLAKDLVAGTGYRALKLFPEFTYDPEKPIIGTWDDTLTTTLGIAAFTLELWDPYAWAGVENKDPVVAFRDPDPALVAAIVRKATEEGNHVPWRAFDHPQLGPVELGGIAYQRTVRNPPDALLPAECDRMFMVADRLRRSLPRVHASVSVEPVTDGMRRITLSLENLGALSTASLEHAVTIGTSRGVAAEIALPDGARLVEGSRVRALPHLDGWFTSLHGFGRNALYPELPSEGHRQTTTWWIRGSGAVRIRWDAGRGGRGEIAVD